MLGKKKCVPLEACRMDKLCLRCCKHGSSSFVRTCEGSAVLVVVLLESRAGVRGCKMFLPF